MSWWAWIVVTGMWVLLMIDNYLLRQAVDHALRVVDSRRIDAVFEVQCDVNRLAKKLDLD